jgi:hypothetical protein
MKATHTDYLHKRHLRVEQGGDVFCMAPSCSDYSKLFKSSLPVFGTKDTDKLLPRHSTTVTLGD